METGEILMELLAIARKDEKVRKAFLETKNDPHPLAAFCRIGRDVVFLITSAIFSASAIPPHSTHRTTP